MLHSKVLSWLPLSAAVELLDPGLGFSAAAAEPAAGGGAAVAIYSSLDPLNEERVTPPAPSVSKRTHKEVLSGGGAANRHQSEIKPS